MSADLADLKTRYEGVQSTPRVAVSALKTRAEDERRRALDESLERSRRNVGVGTSDEIAARAERMLTIADESTQLQRGIAAKAGEFTKLSGSVLEVITNKNIGWWPKTQLTVYDWFGADQKMEALDQKLFEEGKVEMVDGMRRYATVSEEGLAQLSDIKAKYRAFADEAKQHKTLLEEDLIEGMREAAEFNFHDADKTAELVQYRRDISDIDDALDELEITRARVKSDLAKLSEADTIDVAAKDAKLAELRGITDKAHDYIDMRRHLSNLRDEAMEEVSEALGEGARSAYKVKSARNAIKMISSLDESISNLKDAAMKYEIMFEFAVRHDLPVILLQAGVYSTTSRLREKSDVLKTNAMIMESLSSYLAEASTTYMCDAVDMLTNRNMDSTAIDERIATQRAWREKVDQATVNFINGMTAYDQMKNSDTHSEVASR